MPAKHASLDEALAGVVGRDHVHTHADDIAPYLSDWRGRYTGRARAVVRPGTTAEVAAVAGLCHERRVPIVAQGGNTSQVGGATPTGTGDAIVLALTRMNRLRSVDRDNATLTVEAGMTLVAVQQAAAEAGMLFPLSLAAEGSCTIGGNIATNAGGTAVLRYGNTRELVLGLEVVLADGRVWNGLRALRKDNTGYDLKQLFIGSEGTLGIVTAAVLKLYPPPRVQATAFVALANVTGAVGLLRELRAALGDRLTGFELMSALTVALSRRHLPALPDPLPGHPWYALVQVDECTPGVALAEQVEAVLGQALETGIAQDAVLAQSKREADALWTLRENLAEAQRRDGPNIKHDISLPVSAIPTFLDEAAAALGSAFPGCRIVAFGHLGDGNLHYNVAAPEGASAEQFMTNMPAANRIVHDLVTAHGGSISAEHGIGQSRAAELIRYKAPLELELMRAIKHTLDPHGLLNPGKVLA